MNTFIHLAKITWIPDNQCGWGNGYVSVPVGHPWYGIDYSELPHIDISGGITFSQQLTPGFWTIGFDTAHSWNDPEIWTMGRVLEETLKLQQIAENAWSK